MKHTGDICIMTLITWSDDVDPIYFSYTYQAIFRDFEFEHGFEKSQARAREARKMLFCTPRQLFVHARL